MISPEEISAAVDAYVGRWERMLGPPLALAASPFIWRLLADQHEACAAWLADAGRAPRALAYRAAAAALRARAGAVERAGGE
jgi:hypothetical protein